MYQKRDYVIGIISFFLTLSIGIFIGAALSDNIIVNQQKEVVERLEEELTRISISQNLLEEELSRWNSFQVDILPALVKNNLEEVEIALIYGERKILDLEIFQLLETAGAEIKREAFIKPQHMEGLLEEKLEKQVNNLLERFFPGERNEFNLVEENKIAEIRGPGRDFNKVIIFGEGLEGLFAGSRAGEFLVKGLAAKDLEVIGVLSSFPPVNYIPGAEEMVLVEDIESLTGQLDLIHYLHN